MENDDLRQAIIALMASPRACSAYCKPILAQQREETADKIIQLFADPLAKITAARKENDRLRRAFRDKSTEAQQRGEYAHQMERLTARLASRLEELLYENRQQRRKIDILKRLRGISEKRLSQAEGELARLEALRAAAAKFLLNGGEGGEQ